MAPLVQQVLGALLLIAFVASGYQWFRLLRRRRRAARDATPGASLPAPTQQTAGTADDAIGGEAGSDEATAPSSDALSPYAPPATEAGTPPEHRASSRNASTPPRRPPLVPIEPRERPFWGPSDFLIWFGVMLVASVLFRAALGPAAIGAPTAPLAGPEAADPPPEEASGEAPEQPAGEPTARDLLKALAAHSLAAITATLVTLAVLRIKSRRALSQLGLMPKRGDLRLGLAASLLILPPAMLLMALVNLLVPYEHPVLDLLAAAPSPTVFAGLFISTVLITPAVEEFSMRVVLQGGLQSIADSRSVDLSAPPHRQWRPRAAWPIVVTSLLFSLLHAGQGLAPIPLFFLALGLGYLYRQTGRFFPPLIVHTVLNAITMVVTFTDLLVA